MTTIRKILSYDDIEDADIHHFLNSLPERQKSKYIRIAIRTYMAQQQGKEVQSSSISYIKTDHKQQPKEDKDNDEFVDADKSIYDLGK